MIFVTVGTHEQPFDRLIRALDSLPTSEKIIAQTGYSTYEPKNFQHIDMFGADEMSRLMREARIVITHGGPGSIMLAFEHGKIPIVVPRQHAYGEHVNDHQVAFTKFLQDARRVLAVYDISLLSDVIKRYDELVQGCVRQGSKDAAVQFCTLLENMINEMFEDN